MSLVGDTYLQIVVGSFEWLILLAGIIVLLRSARSLSMLRAWLRPNRMPHWPVSGIEFVILLLLAGAFMLITSYAATQVFASRLKGAPDRAGLELFVFGIAQHGGALLAWPVFSLVRRWQYLDYGVQAPPLAIETAKRVKRPVRAGLTLLLAAMPVLILVNLLWNFVLTRLGLPDEPQDLLAIFNGAKSPWVIAGMLLVACVVAPVNEEMIFRGAIYRFARQHLGRSAALWISSLLFGALHVNWSTYNGLASFVPLALLGSVFALIYEKTGCLWVSMLAHGLFNLNTIVYLLSGLP